MTPAPSLLLLPLRTLPFERKSLLYISPQNSKAGLCRLDYRIAEFPRRIQDFAHQHAPLPSERNSLRQSHTALTSERAILTTSIAQCICALANTVPDSTLSNALSIVATALRVASLVSALSLPRLDLQTLSCHEGPVATSDRPTSSVHLPLTPPHLTLYLIHGTGPPPQRSYTQRFYSSGHPKAPSY